jgi:DNA-binding transcriptional ArsR family regulator
MPYKFETDKVKLPEGKDRRVKLSNEDKEVIKALYATGDISTYKLAEEFNVSRRTISFVLDPQKKKANLERLEERGGSKVYYDKDKHKEYMKNYRRYKREVMKGE